MENMKCVAVTSSLPNVTKPNVEIFKSQEILHVIISDLVKGLREFESISYKGVDEVSSHNIITEDELITVSIVNEEEFISIFELVSKGDL